MAGQARYAGLGAFTGFDLNALHFLLVAHDIPQCKWLEAIESLEVIADVGRKHWNEVEDKKK